MDWVLPDPAKHISGHHFDVAFRDGTYWLTDVSTNGTFVQGQQHRLEGPYRLQGGERLIVGHFVIAVEVSQVSGDATVAAVHALPGNAPAVEADPWDLGETPLNPVNPLPKPASNPHHLDDVAQDFVPLQLPSIPHGKETVPVNPRVAREMAQAHARAQGVQQPSVPESNPEATMLSHPPFVPPPTGVQDARNFSSAPVPPAQQPVAMATPPQATQTDDKGRAVIEAFCRGAGLSLDAGYGVDPAHLAEQLGRSVRRSADEIMNMLQDRANVKQFTRGGERTMRSATGNNPMKFLPDSEQAMEAMFLNPRDGFMTGPDGFENALQDLRQHQMAVFAALQPALAEVLKGLAPEDIEGRDPSATNLLTSAKGRHWDTYVNRWDEKAEQGDHGMLDAFLQAFAKAYSEASKAG